MPMEHSAGTIIYRKGNYLLLHYEAGHWDFPKGHIEKGEYAWETAKREAFEETGIKDLFLVKGFKHMIEYFFKDKGEIIHKNVVLFLVETNTEKVTISYEHIGFEWLNYTQARARITYKSSKEALDKANSFMENAKRT